MIEITDSGNILAMAKNLGNLTYDVGSLGVLKQYEINETVGGVTDAADYFSFNLTQANGLYFNLSSTSNTIFEIINSTGTSVGTLGVGSPYYPLYMLNLDAGAYYIKVTAANSIERSAYIAKLVLAPTDVAKDDFSVIGPPKKLNLGSLNADDILATTSYSWYGLDMSGNNNMFDAYSFDLTADAKVDFRLTVLKNSGLTTLSIASANGNAYLGTINGGSNIERHLVAGRYYMYVYGYSENKTDWVTGSSGPFPIKYELQIATGTAVAPSTGPIAPSTGPTAAADVVSLYSDAYTATTGFIVANWGQGKMVADTTIGTDHVLRGEQFTYQGFEFDPVDATAKGLGKLHLDIWSQDSTKVRVYVISKKAGGGAEDTDYVEVTPTAGAWKGVDVDLSQFPKIDPTQIFQVKLDTALSGVPKVMYFDNIYFGKDDAPTASIFSPADEATSVAIGANVVVTFSEAIQRGAGSIVLKKADGTTVATYGQSSTEVTVSGSTLTINPASDLAYGTGYKVEFSPGSVQDLAGNNYAGTTSYNFTTAATQGGGGQTNVTAKFWKDTSKAPSESNKAGAVNLTDAISILKMIVGLTVNSNGAPLSPYQAVAADFDQNGSVDLSDAIGVLKMVVGLNAPSPTWKYFDDAKLASSYIATQQLTSKAWSAGAVVDVSSTADSTVKVVGVLTGDVDGSWAG